MIARPGGAGASRGSRAGSRTSGQARQVSSVIIIINIMIIMVIIIIIIISSSSSSSSN